MLANFIKNLGFGWDTSKDYQQNPQREKNDIGISVNRGGKGYASHTVSLIGEGEMLELKYHNWDSSIYAKGALRAAEFLNNLEGKTGFYTMEDMN